MLFPAGRQRLKNIDASGVLFTPHCQDIHNTATTKASTSHSNSLIRHTAGVPSMKDSARERLLDKLQSGYKLPTLSAIAMQLVKLATDEHSTSVDLAELIRQDPSLSARLMRLANSSYYRTKNPLTTLQQAVNRVGFQRMRIMALSISLRDSFPMGKVGQMDYEKFWRTSMYRSLLAQSLAQHLQRCDPEEAFVAALTLDIGLLVLFDICIKGKKIDIDLGQDDQKKLLEWEREHIGIDHRQVGKEVLSRWNFPNEITVCQETIGISDITEQSTELAKITSLATDLTRLVFAQPDSYQKIFAESKRIFGLTPEVIDTILQEHFQQIQEIADVLLENNNSEESLLPLLDKAHKELSLIFEKMNASEQVFFEEVETTAEESSETPSPDKTPSKIPKFGTVYGRYRIEKVLGQGAMGHISLAYDNKLARRVAIKTLNLDSLKNKEARELAQNFFLQEARVTANLHHSHISTIFDMGIEEGTPYIIMEFIDGKDLRQLIKTKAKFSLQQKLTIISMIARALNYTHQRGILHRDIKPANIMIQRNGIPKVTDFGIARIMDANSSNDLKNFILEKSGFFATPNFMAPEQIKYRIFDNRSDIFSLGVLAYNWLSFQKPFQGNTVQKILNTIVQKAPPPLSQICQVDKRLEKIINRAIAKNPHNRYQNAEDFSDALELYIDKLGRESQQQTRDSFKFDKRKVMENLKREYIFFSNFSIDELFVIFDSADKEKFKKDEYIIREGTNGTKLYIIISGSISVRHEVNGEEIEIATLPAGSCFGEMAIVDRMPRSASVIAREATNALSLNETVLRHLQPKLCLKLYRNLAAIISERLRAIDLQRNGTPMERTQPT